MRGGGGYLRHARTRHGASVRGYTRRRFRCRSMPLQWRHLRFTIQRRWSPKEDGRHYSTSFYDLSIPPTRGFGFRPPRWRRACWGRRRLSQSGRTARGRGAPMVVAASANVASRMEARLVIRSAVFISDLLATSCRITRCSGERPQGRASFRARSRTARRRGKAFLRKRRPLRGAGSSPFVPSHADHPAFIAVSHGTPPPSTHAVPPERRNQAMPQVFPPQTSRSSDHSMPPPSSSGP